MMLETSQNSSFATVSTFTRVQVKNKSLNKHVYCLQTMVSRYEGLLSERQPMLPDSLVQKENIAISKRSRYYFGSVLSFPERLSELIISLSQSS